MQTLEHIIYCPSARLSMEPKALPCKFVSAILVFAVLNLVFLCADKTYALSAKMKNALYFDFSGIEKLCLEKSTKDDHDIVLLGSSLIIYPIWKLDRRFGVECSDPNHYHDAIYLSKKLSVSQNSAIAVRNLGVGGAMISDYFLLLQKYLSLTTNNPDWVIVDCAPRSFFDGGLSTASDTPIFDFFYNVFDALISGKNYLPSLNSCFELCAGQSCYIYKNRRWLKDVLLGCLKDHMFYNKRECEHNIAKTSISITQRKIQSSLEEYKGRYFAISEKAIQTQLSFLELLADNCSKRKIKLLLVNMPLTTLNKGLLDPSFYHTYTNSLKTIALLKGNDIYFLDLGSNEKFKLADFDDSVHLNAQGAIKLQNEIVDFINNAAP
jgi:hypothetical protein